MLPNNVCDANSFPFESTSQRHYRDNKSCLDVVSVSVAYLLRAEGGVASHGEIHGRTVLTPELPVRYNYEESHWT